MPLDLTGAECTVACYLDLGDPFSDEGGSVPESRVGNRTLRYPLA